MAAGDSASATEPAAEAAPVREGGADASARWALEHAAKAYHAMVQLRVVSARMVVLQRRGAIASHASSVGEEAPIVAAALAARERDWIFPGAREWGAALARGLDLGAYVRHQLGARSGAAKGHAPPDFVVARAVSVVPPSAVAGANAPQAVGCAWAAKIKKDDVVAVALLGDGATSTGDFHNAMNFAGVFKTPCVVVCRNNGRATSVPLARQTRTETLAEKAVAYGVASAREDGGDALAVLALVRAAVVRAAAGKGTTLVEVVTTPLGDALDEARLEQGDVLDLGDADPLPRLRRALERDGRLEPGAHERAARSAREALDAALAAAEAEGPPEPGTIFDDVYAARPPHLAAQEREMRSWRR